MGVLSGVAHSLSIDLKFVEENLGSACSGLPKGYPWSSFAQRIFLIPIRCAKFVFIHGSLSVPSTRGTWAVPQRLVTAYVLVELERFSEELEHLEELVLVRPEHALACRYVAYCAFRSGDHVKALDYAKTDRRLWDSTESDAWQWGDYRVRR